MNSLRFYFHQSLIGYFYRRAKQKWFVTTPATMEYHGVTLQLESLPQSMQNVLMGQNYEMAEIDILRGFVSTSDQVLEIGGAIGFMGLYCRKVVKIQKLVSVEPNPNTLTNLRRNYELNGIVPNVIPAAMAAADGPVTFFLTDMFWADSLLPPAEGGPSKQIIVEGLTFKSIVERVGFEFNTLLVDIEGAEQLFSINPLPDHVKKVLIEIHPDIIGVRKAYGVIETFIRAGFEVYGHRGNSWGLVRI